MGGDDPLKAMKSTSYLHAMLVDIHPFADGNGRTARLAQNVALMSCGLPPFSVLAADKLSYYGALDSFHLVGEMGPFAEFCMVESLKTWGAAGRDGSGSPSLKEAARDALASAGGRAAGAKGAGPRSL